MTKLNSNLTSIKKRGYPTGSYKKSSKRLGISVFDKELTINRGLETLTSQANVTPVKQTKLVATEHTENMSQEYDQ